MLKPICDDCKKMDAVMRIKMGNDYADIGETHGLEQRIVGHLGRVVGNIAFGNESTRDGVDLCLFCLERHIQASVVEYGAQ